MTGCTHWCTHPMIGVRGCSGCTCTQESRGCSAYPRLPRLLAVPASCSDVSTSCPSPAGGQQRAARESQRGGREERGRKERRKREGKGEKKLASVEGQGPPTEAGVQGACPLVGSRGAKPPDQRQSSAPLIDPQPRVSLAAPPPRRDAQEVSDSCCSRKISISTCEPAVAVVTSRKSTLELLRAQVATPIGENFWAWQGVTEDLED